MVKFGGAIPEQTIYPIDRVDQFLTADGLASGVSSITGNLSASARDYYIQPPAGQVYVLHWMSLTIVGSGGSSKPGFYGQRVTPLTNGIDLWVKNSTGTTLADLSGGVKIKTNQDWSSIIRPDFQLTDILTSVSSTLHFRRDFTYPIVISETEKFGITVQDDFSTAVAEQRIYVSGLRYRAVATKTFTNRHSL